MSDEAAPGGGAPAEGPGGLNATTAGIQEATVIKAAAEVGAEDRQQEGAAGAEGQAGAEDSAGAGLEGADGGQSGEATTAAGDNGAATAADEERRRYQLALEEAAARQAADQAAKFANLFQERLQEASVSYMAFAAPFDKLQTMVNERFAVLQEEHQSMAAKQREQAEEQWTHAQTAKKAQEQQAQVNTELAGELQQAKEAVEAAQAETARLAKENEQIKAQLKAVQARPEPEAEPEPEPAPAAVPEELPMPDPEESTLTDEAFRAMVDEIRAALESKIAKLAAEQQMLTQGLEGIISGRDDLSLTSEGPSQQLESAKWDRVDRKFDKLETSVRNLEDFQVQASEQAQRMTETMKGMADLEQRLNNRFDDRVLEVQSQLTFLDERLGKIMEDMEQRSHHAEDTSVNSQDNPAPVVVRGPSFKQVDDLEKKVRTVGKLFEDQQATIAEQKALVEQQHAEIERHKADIEQHKADIEELKASRQPQQEEEQEEQEDVHGLVATMNLELRRLEELTREELDTIVDKVKKVESQLAKIAPDEGGTTKRRDQVDNSEWSKQGMVAMRGLVAKLNADRDMMSLATAGAVLPAFVGHLRSKRNVLPADSIPAAHDHDKLEEEQQQTSYEAQVNARQNGQANRTNAGGVHHQNARTYLHLRSCLEHMATGIQELIQYKYRKAKQVVPDRLNLPKGGLELKLMELEQLMSLIQVEWTNHGLSERMEKTCRQLLREIEELYHDHKQARTLALISHRMFEENAKKKDIERERRRKERERIKNEREEDLMWAAEEAGEEYIPPEQRNDPENWDEEEDDKDLDVEDELPVMEELEMLAAHLSQVLTAMALRAQRLGTEDMQRDIEFNRRQLALKVTEINKKMGEGLDKLEKRFGKVVEQHIEHAKELKTKVRELQSHMAEMATDPHKQQDFGAALDEVAQKLTSHVAGSSAELQEMRSLMGTKASKNEISNVEKSVQKAKDGLADLQQNVQAFHQTTTDLRLLTKQVQGKADHTAVRKLTSFMKEQQEEAKRLAEEEAAAASTHSPLRCLSCWRKTQPQVGVPETHVTEGQFHAGTPLSAQPSISGTEHARAGRMEQFHASQPSPPPPLEADMDRMLVTDPHSQAHMHPASGAYSASGPMVSIPAPGQTPIHSNGGKPGKKRPHTAGAMRSDPSGGGRAGSNQDNPYVHMLPAAGPFSERALDQGSLPLSQRIFVEGGRPRPVTAGRSRITDARKRGPQIVRTPARGPAISRPASAVRR